MSGSDYTTTPNLGLFKPNYSKDVGNWGNHLNANADKLDAAIAASGVPEAPADGMTYGRQNGATWTGVLPLAGGALTGPLTLAADPAVALGAATKQYVDAHVPTGGPFLPISGGTMTGALTLTTPVATAGYGARFTGSATQITADTQYVQVVSDSVYTADSAGGANLGFASTVTVDAGGNHYSATHSSAVYGVMSARGTNAAGVIDFLSGVQGTANNGGAGTLTNGASFRAHNDTGNGSGALVNSYGFYQEQLTSAVNKYGFAVSHPSAIGFFTPSYNLDIQSASTGMFPANGFRLRFSGGTTDVLMTTSGMTVGPAYAPGAGGLGVMDLIVGPASGAQNALNVTTGFLYLPSCAGTPSGIPLRQVAARIAIEADTVAEKIWAYINGAWKFLQLTDPAAAPGIYLPLTGGALTGALSVTTGPSLTSALAVNGQAAPASGNSVSHVGVQGLSTYAADASAGNSFGVSSTLSVDTGGFHLSAPGNAGMFASSRMTGTNAASVIDALAGIMSIVGNGGLGTLTTGAAFRARTDFNTGGGVLTNSYGFYQEQLTSAVNKYGFCVSHPSAIGFFTPSYNLDIQSASAGMNPTNGLRVRFGGTGAADLLVTTSGITLGNAFTGGQGSFSATDILVANTGGTQNANSATTGYLYLPSCAGPPTGVPVRAGLARVALVFDTTNSKLWAFINSAWKGVVVA